MSHFVTAKINLKNDRLLRKALSKMNLSYEEGSFQITQYGRTETAQIKFDRALGLQKQADGSWLLVGDPYHSTNRQLSQYYGRQQQFADDLATSYAITETTENLEAMNMQCVENPEGTVGRNGKIRMVFQTLI